MDTSKLLTPAQVAERLQIETATVQGWLRTGRLKGVKLGRYWRIRPEAVDEMIAEAERASRQRIVAQSTPEEHAKAVKDAWEDGRATKEG